LKINHRATLNVIEDDFFQSDVKKGPKFGRIFNGKSVITFARNVENGKFQEPI
jgi:hypothetical protein